MANIKFSQFSQSTDVANVDFVVGYDGATNVRISPADLVATAGPFLPLAGGTMTGDLRLNDNVELELGSNADLKIYHDGNNSNYITSTTSDIYLRNEGNNDRIYIQATNSGTLANYITIDGSAGRTTFSKNIRLNDNVQAQFGSSSDLEIYHNGTNSAIDNYVDDLFIRNYADNKDIRFMSDDGSGGTATYFIVDGSEVETGFFKTTHHYDNVQARFGDSGDLRIYHDGSNSYIEDSGVGSLKILAQNFDLNVAANNASMIKAVDGGTVELYFGGAKKFETTSTGVAIAGNATLDSTSNTTLRIQAKNPTAFNDPILEFVTHNEASGASSGKIQLTNGAFNSNDMAFFTETNNSVTEKMRIFSNGSITFNSYDASNNTGTATFLLGTDANGNVVKTTTVPSGSGGPFLPLAGGTITGSLSITGDGSNAATFTESGSGDFEISIVDDLRLTAGGNDIVLRGASAAEFGRLSNDSNNFVIRNTTSDKDIIFKGTDGGTEITALTLDMSKGGYVGIGTDSPSELLELKPASGADSKINMLKSDGTQKALIGYDNGNGGLINLYNEAGTRNVVVRGYGDSYFNGGNVGIGITPPVSKLHVYQNGTQVDTDAGITIEQDGTGDAALSFLLSSVRRWKLGIDNSDSDKFKISSATNLESNNKLTIDVDGNVGIGTTSPTDTLTISNDNNLLLGLDSPAANDAQLRFYSAGSYKNIIYRPANSNDLRFNTSTSGDVLTIQQSGNIGIGLTSPTAKLEILNADFTGQFKTAQVGSSFKFGIGSGSAYAAFMVGATGTAQFMRAYHDNSIISIGENGANVGIGTINPASKLEVDGGDIEVDDSASGLILKSPDGTRYRVTVANGGTLSVAAV